MSPLESAAGGFIVKNANGEENGQLSNGNCFALLRRLRIAGRANRGFTFICKNRQTDRIYFCRALSFRRKKQQRQCGGPERLRFEVKIRHAGRNQKPRPEGVSAAA
jgi:hypothetical protein